MLKLQSAHGIGESAACSPPRNRRWGMDYAGQKLAEQINFYILTLFAIVAFGAGYAAGSFALLVKIYVAGLLVDAALVLPDWPWLNQKPLQWLPAAENRVQDSEKVKGKRS